MIGVASGSTSAISRRPAVISILALSWEPRRRRRVGVHDQGRARTGRDVVAIFSAIFVWPWRLAIAAALLASRSGGMSVVRTAIAGARVLISRGARCFFSLVTFALPARFALL